MLEIEILLDLAAAGEIHITDIDNPHEINWRIIKNSVKIVDGCLLWR